MLPQNHSPRRQAGRYKYINLRYNKIAVVFIVSAFLMGCVVEKEEYMLQDEKIDNRENVIEETNVVIKEIIESDMSTVKEPLQSASERITKKPFGLLVMPENSPVQSERFSGYHTGTDFEVFDDEFDTDVYVYALCAGEILSTQMVNGYGGVIMQSCTIDDEETRILYGHVSLLKEFVTVGSGVTAGEKIAILGKHESAETSGERKHLHLGIVKGDRADLRGYVQNEDELLQWVDYEQIISNR